MVETLHKSYFLLEEANWEVLRNLKILGLQWLQGKKGVPSTRFLSETSQTFAPD